MKPSGKECVTIRSALAVVSAHPSSEEHDVLRTCLLVGPAVSERLCSRGEVHRNGREIVMATAADAPKTKVLTNGSKVAVSIDRDYSAPKILLIRGTVRADTVEGIAPEYTAMIHRTMSQEDAEALLKEAACLYPRMTRIFIHPDWVGILDFETRLPSAVERAIERG